MSDAIENIRLDVRAAWETAAFTTEVNRRDGLQYITAEFHIIPQNSPFRVRLDELPDRESGLNIPGLYGDDVAAYTIRTVLRRLGHGLCLLRQL